MAAGVDRTQHSCNTHAPRVRRWQGKRSEVEKQCAPAHWFGPLMAKPMLHTKPRRPGATHFFISWHHKHLALATHSLQFSAESHGAVFASLGASKATNCDVVLLVTVQKPGEEDTTLGTMSRRTVQFGCSGGSNLQMPMRYGPSGHSMSNCTDVFLMTVPLSSKRVMDNTSEIHLGGPCFFVAFLSHLVCKELGRV